MSEQVWGKNATNRRLLTPSVVIRYDHQSVRDR